ncbi:MAG: hypothetical protein LBV12_00125 [Puniceicoccales bacterium]|jgi:hypothetical protein|nr:hypothetical protein [Puniceicoccales bacterium]
MKKTLAAATLAILGSGSLFAQTGIPDFDLSGRIAYESEYIYRGKEHSDTNVQLSVLGKYSIPTTGFAAYGGVFGMLPIKQEANQVDWTLGGQYAVDMYTIDAGYVFHSYPNQKTTNPGIPGGWQNPITNRGVYNRSNEIYIGARVDLEWLTPAAYIYYDFNLQQVTYEASLRRQFEGIEFGIPDIAINLSVYAGYVSANQYNGDQRAAGVPKWSNDYGYIGFSADLIYHVTNYADIGVGLRYAWNSDNSSFDIPGNTDDNLWWGTWVRFNY